jgi:hypothetical protein
LLLPLLLTTTPSYPGPEYLYHSHSVAAALVVARMLHCSEGSGLSGGRQCDFAAAAGAYVDRDGRLYYYATEHDAYGPGGSVRMMEFRPHDHLDHPGTASREGCATVEMG